MSGLEIILLILTLFIGLVITGIIMCWFFVWALRRGPEKMIAGVTVAVAITIAIIVAMILNTQISS